MDIMFKSNINMTDYYKERQKKWIWIFPKIDKKVTSKQIVDLDTFCKIIFPHSIKKQEVSKLIIQILIESKKPMYLREIRYQVFQKIKISTQTLSDTYKAMLRAGILDKKYRNFPTRLSRQFSNRLRDIADYWENYLDAKNV
jgi:DNA-binding HxlR family transcriptional regulator